MAVTIKLPAEAEAAFRQSWGDDLDRATLEALIIEGYRQRRFGLATVRRLLGFETRLQAEQWLGERGVNWNYSAEDLDADRLTAEHLLGKRPH
jgi:hypothetical protein